VCSEGKASLVPLASPSSLATEAEEAVSPESASWTLTQNHVLDVLQKTMVSSSGSDLTSQVRLFVGQTPSKLSIQLVL